MELNPGHPAHNFADGAAKYISQQVDHELIVAEVECKKGGENVVLVNKYSCVSNNIHYKNSALQCFLSHICVTGIVASKFPFVSHYPAQSKLVLL